MWGLKVEKAPQKWEDIGMKKNLKTNIGGVYWDGQDIGREWISVALKREDGPEQRLPGELGGDVELWRVISNWQKQTSDKT